MCVLLGGGQQTLQNNPNFTRNLPPQEWPEAQSSPPRFWPGLLLQLQGDLPTMWKLRLEGGDTNRQRVRVEVSGWLQSISKQVT